MTKLKSTLSEWAMVGLEGIARGTARLGIPITSLGQNSRVRLFTSINELVSAHFERIGEPNHVNVSSMLEALCLLREEPKVIVETGSAAWGTRSSELFDAHAASFGGSLWSVDIRLRPLLELRKILSPNSSLSCDDSVRFLRSWASPSFGRRADLVYLDSMDLVPGDPIPAANHCLNEFLAVAPALGEESLLLIDDTPLEIDFLPEEHRRDARMFYERTGSIPGKGMLLVAWLDVAPGVTKVTHGYQVLYHFHMAAVDVLSQLSVD